MVAGVALLLSLVVFGLEPALRLTGGAPLRPDLASASGNGGVPQAARQRRLVRWQVAISTGFFILATMSQKYIVEEARHDSGVDLDHVALATMNFWAQQWDEDRARRALARVLDELEKDPQIRHAAVTTGVPFGASNTPRFTIATADRSLADRDSARQALGIAATPRIFQTLGVPILRGRGFDERDTAGARPVVVLSEQTARRLFGTIEVVGNEIQLKPSANTEPRRRTVAGKLALQTSAPAPRADAEIEMATVVGVAGDTDVGRLFSRKGDLFYLPLSQQPAAVSFGIAIVRTEISPYVAVRLLRDAIRRVDQDLAVESSGTGLGALGGPAVFLRTASLMALSLGGLSLLLTMVGLHGVQSHGVTQRTREFGVRLVLGADERQLLRAVVRRGAALVGGGVAVGVVVATGAARVVAALLYGVETFDAATYAIVAALVVGIGLMATFVPARRVGRIDPAAALRT